MTAPKQAASTAQEQAGAVAGTAKDQAVSVAQTATSAAGEVTGTAKEQVGAVVGETAAQAKNLTGQVRQQATQQVASQTEKATSALRDLSRQLSEGDTSGMVGTVLTEVGQRVQSLADALEQKGPQGLLEDLRRYARRSPGTFVLAAAAAGLVSGRLAKGMTAGSATPALPSGTGVTAYPSATTGTSAAGTDPFGGSTYAATTPATGVYGSGTPAYGTTEPAYGASSAYSTQEPATGVDSYGTGDAYGDPEAAPVYPGTETSSPYSAGYAQGEPYGSRGSL